VLQYALEERSHAAIAADLGKNDSVG